MSFMRMLNQWPQEADPGAPNAWVAANAVLLPKSTSLEVEPHVPVVGFEEVVV